MGFLTYTMPPTPVLQREDLAAAAARLLDKKGQPQAGWIAPELEYLDRQLQANESVLSAATLAISGRDSCGVLAFTGRRIFSVLGGRDSKRRPVGGRPTVDVFEIASIDHISGQPYIKTFVDTSLVMKNGDRYSFLVGPSVDHGQRFLGSIQEAVDKAKFQ
jgi:hypothetical protein